MATPTELADVRDTGRLGVYHLKRYWSAMSTVRNKASSPPRAGEDALDTMLLNGLGLGLHQTLRYLFANTPDFPTFEAWVAQTACALDDPERIARLNAAILGDPPPPETQRHFQAIVDAPPVLDDADLACWNTLGYVVLPDAVDAETRDAARDLIWDYVGADPADRESWYRHAKRDASHPIMVELIQHPILERLRQSPRIHKAFAQLFGTVDLWPSADRCGFHPPQTPGFPFPGPTMHWDANLSQPLGFAAQGILYLTDTPPEQGATQVVPGFQHRLTAWLAGLAPDRDPQLEDLDALGPVPIGGNAGDLLIWHHALPHGPSPNHGTQPRIVQYLTMHPGWRVPYRPVGG